MRYFSAMTTWQDWATLALMTAGLACWWCEVPWVGLSLYAAGWSLQIFGGGYVRPQEDVDDEAEYERWLEMEHNREIGE